MNIRPYLQFYKAIFPFVAAAGIICLVAFGPIWAFGMFATICLGFGFIGFTAFRKQEYYFYQNLGLTKLKLMKSSFLLNLLIGIPLFSLILLIMFLFLGDLTLT